jgi:hypothetical protein
MADKFKFLYATDLHASEVCFRKFLNAAKPYGVQGLVLGGDVTGKMVVPLTEVNGVYSAKIYGTMYEARGEKELELLKRKIRDLSGYPIMATMEERTKMDSDPKVFDETFDKAALATLEGWLELAEERLKGTGIKFYVTGGNDDPRAIAEIINKHATDTVIATEDRIVTLPSGHEMLSLGYSNPTPWHLPRDIPEEELEKKIENLTAQVKDMKTAVFNFHCPPYDTPPLDYAPELINLKPQMTGGGQFKMVPVGSKAVRKSIEKYQPLLGLHGHIHESKGAVNVGRTLCLNPGSEYGEGVLKGVIVEIKGDKKPVINFTSG